MAASQGLFWHRLGLGLGDRDEANKRVRVKIKVRVRVEMRVRVKDFHDKNMTFLNLSGIRSEG
jgi:hypothetical protein